MYPLLLKPAVKDYLWGGKRLIDEYGFETSGEKAAEAWVLSARADGESIIANGKLGGKALCEALSVWGKAAIGKRAEKFEYFPILIKLIDARDKLSVQVHPDDEYALKNEGEYGKTEMWYIIDCDEDARLVYGFNKETSKGEFEQRIKNNTLDEVLNYVPVKKGDAFFIEAGTIHAIGKGILIAEIQQNSNTTYRVSDYGRLGADGKPRELHIEKALDVTITSPPRLPYGDTGKTEQTPFGSLRELAKCGLFTCSLINLSGKTEIFDEESFVSLVLLSGEIKISFEGGEISAKKGDSIFVPSGLKITLSGNAEIIKSGV